MVCLTSFTAFSGDLKKTEKEKKRSENDQLTGHFLKLFYLFFVVPANVNLKKSRKSTNKNNLAIIHSPQSRLPQPIPWDSEEFRGIRF